MSRQVVLQFPVDLPEEGLRDKEALEKGKEIIVLELLRKGEISQGKAVELLGIDRHTLFDLMSKHDIAAVEMTEQEFLREMGEL